MTAEWVVGLVITLGGALISHFAGYQLYKYKLKSVFRKVNDLEKKVEEKVAKQDFRDALTDLKLDIRDLRDQVHSLVVALAKGQVE